MEYMLPEIIYPDRLHDKSAFQFDFSMMACLSDGAREGTKREMQQLALAVGFAQVNLIVDANSLSILEMHKNQ